MSQAQGPAAERSTSFGQARALNPVDRAGVWMRFQTVRRHVELDGRRLGDFGCGNDASMAYAALDRASSALLVDLQGVPEHHEYPEVTAIEGSIDEGLPGLESPSRDVVICKTVLEHSLVDASSKPSAIRFRPNSFGFGTFAVCRAQNNAQGG